MSVLTPEADTLSACPAGDLASAGAPGFTGWGGEETLAGVATDGAGATAPPSGGRLACVSEPERGPAAMVRIGCPFASRADRC